MRSAALKKGIKISSALLLCVYLTALIDALFFAEEYGRGAAAIGYNICPFREIMRYIRYRKILGFRTVFLNLAGNVIGFMPLGMLIPILAKNLWSFWKVGVLSFEISLIVEVSQLILQVGCFDVDDMILNTLGSLAGYALVFLINRRWERLLEGKTRSVQRGKTKQEE